MRLRGNGIGVICHHRCCTFRMKHGRGEHAHNARMRTANWERVDKPMRRPTRQGVASTSFAGISVLLFARRAGWERSGAFFPFHRTSHATHSTADQPPHLRFPLSAVSLCLCLTLVSLYSSSSPTPIESLLCPSHYRQPGFCAPTFPPSVCALQIFRSAIIFSL